MARRKGAGLVRYVKPLQQRHSTKDTCYKWGVLERERYIRVHLISVAGKLLVGGNPDSYKDTPQSPASQTVERLAGSGLNNKRP
ncbi:MAG: hypothetical protein DSZ28_07710 [Thiothrix sp.]|nr:MAG: hypothetical protein DSZ28_07710 [Thiothrix sp.]